jgi:hypothetical protein
MTQKKKKVTIMRNKEKILKQNSLRSGINIRLVLRAIGAVATVRLIYAFGAPLAAIVVVYLGYKLLRLIGRLVGLILSLVFTVVSIIIVTVIILLVTF